MALKLTDKIVDKLPKPEQGNRITYDEDVKGFGVRVTAAGARAFILNYRTRSGRERRYTIGSRPDWKTGPAREYAKNLKQEKIDRGIDPMAEKEAERDAKTMADLCDRYIEEHLRKKRDASAVDDRAMIRDYILPKLKHEKVEAVRFADIDDLHRAITKRGTPYRANRVVALLSKMFSLAMKWEWRAARNPCIGIERNREQKRHRYLSPAELGRLTSALAAHKDQQACNIIRLLMLTGARRGEVEAMEWDQLDLTDGVWTKPGSLTKQKSLHRVPLSAPARQLLADLFTVAKEQAAQSKPPKEISKYVFPGRGGKGHREEIKRQWRELCIASELVKIETLANGKTKVTPNARIHDLRHTYASMLASSGLSLPIIGQLLGHSQPATTARYAHLMDDPLRQATERVATALGHGKAASAEIVQINGAKA